jgi:hypothetical protein
MQSPSEQSPAEFREVAHTGGKFTLTVVADEKGALRYSPGWSHNRPTAAAIFAIYALPPGIPIEQLPLGGIGSRMPQPSVPGSVPVFIGSDNEGMFGRQCPNCFGYWRTHVLVQFCPYCGMSGNVVTFLSSQHQIFIQQCCAALSEALRSGPGQYEIDMDAVADAAKAEDKDKPKPRFYYVELSQQNRYECGACGAFNDILGDLGYCTSCGTRNDLQHLQEKTIPNLRTQINTGGPYETCVKLTVSSFDSFVDAYVTQLVARVPMTTGRKNKLKGRFHDLDSVAAIFAEAFDINILESLAKEETAFAELMFHRRHVYEHKGGAADEKYIRESGDNVQPRQALRESQESAHKIVTIVQQLAKNLHNGFHRIFPPDEKLVQSHTDRQNEIKQRAERFRPKQQTNTTDLGGEIPPAADSPSVRL